MRRPFRIAIGIQLAAIAMFAESGPYNYEGQIVNASCLPAAKIVSRNSRGYTPGAGVHSFVPGKTEIIKTAPLRKSIVAHCRINPGATAFALVLDDGNFYKLDDTGNSELLSKMPTTARKVRATVTGSVDREYIKVSTIAFQ